MIFLSPIWFLLLLPLATTLFVWRLPTRGLNLLRAVSMALLVLAMAQPAIRLKDQNGTVVVVADRSESMPYNASDEELETIRTLRSTMSKEDRLAVIGFGERTNIDLEPGNQDFENFRSRSGQQHSRLAGGLEAALSLIPNGHPGRILVISDGHWTGRDPGTFAAKAAGRGIAIDHRWLSRPRTEDLAVHDLQVPQEVLPGQSFMISAWVFSPKEQTVRYTLEKHGQELSTGQRDLPRGLSRLLFRDRAMLPGNATYRLTLHPPVSGEGEDALTLPTSDAIPENNTARALVEARGRKPALLVSNFGAESGLAKLMAKGGMALVARKPNQCPWTLGDLSRWSAVILENVMAGDIGQEGMENLAAWVEETGGGIFLTGGEKSYAPGGYYGSPLEPLIPVSMERRNEIRKLKTAIVVVLDRSGSMSMPVGGGKSKMDLANIGTAQVLDLLAGNDEMGVIAVDSAPHTVLRIGTVDTLRNYSGKKKILSIESMGGGIYVYEGLKAGADMLRSSSAGNRHVILFSDARDSEVPGDYKKLIQAMREAGMSISVIGLGTDTDVDAELLKDIAKRGEGNIYFTDRPREIPRIFAQDTFAVARNTFVKEPSAVGMTGAMAVMGAPANWAPPPVGGYNLTYLREGANVGMYTKDENKAPVVAFWQSGNGRAACFTGEADGEFAGEFPGWDKAGDFYATLADWAAGQDSRLPGQMLLTQEVREGVCYIQLHLDPERQEETFQGNPQVSLLRETPGEPLVKQSLQLAWQTADMLEAAIPLEGAETIRATVNFGDGLSESLPPACLPYSPEFAPDQPGRGRLALAGISQSTGGQERLNVADIWASIPRQPKYVPLSIWLVLAALSIFLAEVLQRRTGFFAFRKKASAIPVEKEVATDKPRAKPPIVTGFENIKPAKYPKPDKEAAPSAQPQADPSGADKPRVVYEGGNTLDALATARKRAEARQQK